MDLFGVKVEKNEHHSLDQSCLYKLKCEKKLAKFLLCSFAEIKKLLENPNDYKVFNKRNGGKIRSIENPSPRLKRVQSRIHKLLSKIEPPSYLHSSTKMRSYVTNASQHVNEGETFKVDIKKFFPSVTTKHILSFFIKEMRCSLRVATILAKICTYEGHLPTGGPHSPILAFCTHRKMFDRIHQIAKENNFAMTLYADDICITGIKITKKIKNLINTSIKNAGLRNKKSKEKHYKKEDVKKITGVIIKNGKMKIPNKLHKEIYEGFCDLNRTDDKNIQQRIFKTIIGKASSANQIECTKWLDRIKKKKSQIFN